METVGLIISILLLIIGLIGTIVPMLPGIILIYAGFFVWGLSTGWRDYGLETMIILGAVTIIVLFLDYYAGAVGAKKYGASQAGFWGAIIGGIVGFILLNLPGIILGPFLGAVAGEMWAGKTQREAWRAGWGTFVGIVAGNLLRIIVAVMMAGVFLYYLIV